MSARGNGRTARKADNLTAFCENFLKNEGASTSNKPMGLHGLLQGQYWKERKHRGKDVDMRSEQANA
jgi:hypothetical protein